MIPQLIFTNFIFMLLVVLFHSFDGSPPNSNPFFYLLLKGVNGIVVYFFVLSGFVLTVNYYNKQPLNIRRYLVSRFARIYPVYFAALLMWILPPMNKGYDLNEAIKIFTTLFLVQSWYPPYSQTYNYPTWFLSVLFFFYLIFPSVLAYITKKKGTKIFLFVSAVWIVSTILLFTFHNKPAFIIRHEDFYDLTLFHPIIMYLNAFIVGIAGGVFMERNKELKYHDLVPAIMVSFSLIILVIILGLDTRITGGRLFFPNGILSPLFLVLIIGLSLDKTILSRFLSNKLFVGLGTISYSMYIFHIPIRYLLGHFFRFNIRGSSLSLFYYIIILIGCSLIIYLLFEKPVKKYIVSSFNKT